MTIDTGDLGRHEFHSTFPAGAAHAASEVDDYVPRRRRWGFASPEQAGETLAEIAAYGIVVAAFLYALFS